MDKTYDAAYFQRWYRRADIGGSARLARKVALAVASAEYYPNDRSAACWTSAAAKAPGAHRC